MSSAFIYRERRGMFVVVSLVIWLILLGLFGRYLPANATITKKQMLVNIHGNQLVGNWIKENGRWEFVEISKIIKLNRSKSRSTAFLVPNARTKVMPMEQGKIGVATTHSSRTITRTVAPATTSSIPPMSRKKVNKRALRATLADEIGSWAKIGQHWEWHESTMKPTSSKTSKVDRPLARWGRRDGIWRFEEAGVLDTYIHI